jgi:glucose/arabinose dehydrogenase
MRFRRIIVLVGLSLAAGAALADDGVRLGPAAYGDWRSDAPGTRRLITPADLAAPYKTQAAANPSRHAPRAPSTLPKVPAGFIVDLFADGLSGPRVVRTAPNGDVFVAESSAGRVRVLRADATNSAPMQSQIFAEGLQSPFGIAFFPSGPDPRWVYVATTPLSLSQRRSGGVGRA